MATFVAGELGASRFPGECGGDAVGQLIARFDHAHPRFARCLPLAGIGVVLQLFGGFAFQQSVEEHVFHRVRKHRDIQAEQRSDYQGEAGESQHQPVAQPFARRGSRAHGSEASSDSSRKPTPCTVLSMGVGKGLSSA
ncbi:hypothetical protein D3C81_1004630 [compost metagenome]